MSVYLRLGGQSPESSCGGQGLRAGYGLDGPSGDVDGWVLQGCYAETGWP